MFKGNQQCVAREVKGVKNLEKRCLFKHCWEAEPAKDHKVYIDLAIFAREV